MTSAFETTNKIPLSHQQVEAAKPNLNGQFADLKYGQEFGGQESWSNISFTLSLLTIFNLKNI